MSCRQMKTASSVSNFTHNNIRFVAASLLATAVVVAFVLSLHSS